MKALKKKIKTATNEQHKALWHYRQWREEPLADLTILLEPQQGRSPSGNIFYVLRSLLRDARFDEYKICYAAKKSSMSMFEDLLSNYEMFERVELVELNSERYVHILATAKYLITDTAFPTYYVKRDDQVVWNTWHGTPLKTLGRSDKGDAYRLGNIQRNLACSSFLSFPNQHTKKCLVEDYMIQNLGTPEILLAGYPRNTVLFNTESPSKFFEENDLSDKTVYAYMPTWRYLKDGLPARMGGIDTLTYLFQIDARLDDNEVMLVSVHPLAKGRIDFKHFDHILPFPADWETYDVLRKCDLLITDYSSVMFDFALTRKKIVLFSYDKYQYLANRGMYFPYENLPFPQVESVTELLAEIRAPKKYDDAKFVTRFCPFETPDATQNLINTVFFGAKETIEHFILETDSKKNVVIYAGNLAQNGITTSLKSLCSAVNAASVNYYVVFTSRVVKRHRDVLLEIPEQIKFIPVSGKAVMQPQEKTVQYLYGKKRIPFSTFDEHLREAYKFECKRQFGKLKIDVAVQFNGYDFKKIYQFSVIESRRVIFAHNDMVREIETRANSRSDLLKYAYQEYDAVAVVSPDIEPSVQHIASNRANTLHVPNLFDYKRVVSLAHETMHFDDQTVSTVDHAEDVITMLEAHGNHTVVSVGRFSPEKQHALLIRAFNDLWIDNQDLKLVIIGGNSFYKTYEETCAYVESLPCKDSVVLIRQVSNPYAFVKQCCGLILPSTYEGFGLVLLEADTLGKPIVSTDIVGPRIFMQEHNGTLVDNSYEGIKEGLRMLYAGEVAPLNLDYEKYNANALNAFYKLLDL